MKRFTRFLICAFFGFSGCVQTTYTEGKAKFSRAAFACKTNAQSIVVVVRPDGTRVAVITGYGNDQSPQVTTTASAVVTAAITAAVKAAGL